MDISSTIQLIVLVILLALSAFFSSSETALTTVNRIRMRSLAEEGNKRAARVLQVTDDSAKMLSAILIGNNVVNLTASSLATALALRIFGNAGAGIATGILTVLILIFGEISPKTMATLRAEKISLRFCNIIWLLMKVLTPVIFIINHLAMLVLRLMGVKASEGRQAMTESELRTIVDVSHESGVIESEEKEMINNVFDFGDATAKDIMVPKVDMSFLDVNASYGQTMEVYRECRYTRYPVYEESTDNVIGMLNVKDLLVYEDKEHFNIRNILRGVLFTHEHKKTSDLLFEMRKSSTNMAIVLDEYGVTSGMVTMEDLLEEIVGDIRDEYDEDEEEQIRKISDLEYIVEGTLSLDDLNDYLDLEEKGLLLESEDFDSVGGIVIELLDRLPEVGDEVTTENGIRLVVESVEKNRIGQVHIYLPSPEKPEELPEN